MPRNKREPGSGASKQRAAAKPPAKSKSKSKKSRPAGPTSGDHPWVATRSNSPRTRTKSDYKKQFGIDVDQLVQFFRAAGVSASFQSPRLKINGRTTPRIEDLLTLSSAKADEVRRELLDVLTVRYAGSRFARSLMEHGRFSHSARAFLDRDVHAFRIRVDGVLVATVSPTSAYLPGNDRPIYGNFLIEGDHWGTLRHAVATSTPTLLAARTTKRPQERETAPAVTQEPEDEVEEFVDYRPPILMTELPSWLPDHLARAAMDASRRIRTERQLAFDRPVVLTSRFGTLRLDPVTGTLASLRVRFELMTRSTTTQGSLRLGPSDPLALSIRDDVPEQDAVRAWVQALLGFADITCGEPPAPRAEAAHSYRAASASYARSGQSSSGGGGHAGSSIAAWCPRLVPVGAWTRRGSFVAGHRRILRPGQHASAAAKAHAKRAGIALRPFETWVQPHSRGIPEGMELTFEWNTPVEISWASALAS